MRSDLNTLGDLLTAAIRNRLTTNTANSYASSVSWSSRSPPTLKRPMY